MSDELIFNASDNKVAPESPTLLEIECYSTIINKSYSIINSFPGPIE